LKLLTPHSHSSSLPNAACYLLVASIKVIYTRHCNGLNSDFIGLALCGPVTIERQCISCAGASVMLKARRHPLIAGFLLLGMLLSDEGQAAANTVVLLPRPAQFSFSSTVIPIVGGLAIRLPAAAGPRLRAAASRFAARLGRATGLNLPLVTNGGVSVEIICPCAPRFRPSLNEDESYQMSVTAEGVRLRAAEEAGILHGFSTLIQLIQQQDTGFGFAPSRGGRASR